MRVIQVLMIVMFVIDFDRLWKMKNRNIIMQVELLSKNRYVNKTNILRSMRHCHRIYRHVLIPNIAMFAIY